MSDAMDLDKLAARFEDLNRSLLTARREDLEEVLSSARALVAWLEEGSAELGGWSKAALAEARIIMRGLESGRPVGAGFDRLSRLVEGMGQSLEQDKAAAKNRPAEPAAAPAPEPTRDEPAKEAPAAGGEPEFKWFNISPEDMPLYGDFLAEAPEHLASIESGLLALTQGQAWDVLSVYRPFHTLKGVFGFMGLNTLNSVTHAAESLLEPYKNNNGQPSNAEIDLLLEVTDAVKAQIEQITQGIGENRFKLLELKELKAKLKKKPKAKVQSEAPAPVANPEPQAAPLQAVGGPSPEAISPSMDAALAAALTAPEPANPKAGPEAGEAQIPLEAAAAPVPHELEVAAEPGRPVAQAKAAGAVDQSIRVSAQKMDALLEAVGELAICQQQVTEGILSSGFLGHISDEAARLAKISRSLQDVVLSLRLVPVQPLFLRMVRLVHDVSKKTGKPVVLDLQGGETELDKGLVEELSEPLVHMLRNSVDHGIEDAATRKAAGKPVEGKVGMRASHQGGDFLLEISDDGKGLDLDRLAEKGKAAGLLKPGEESDRAKVMDLIFAAGLSTAQQVTEFSGRGVGLDAVKRKILELKGGIRVDSERGKGSTFTIRIPLTMALMDAILVRVGQDRYVLPTAKVRQFMALSETQEHAVGGSRSWFVARGEHLPLVDVAEWFGGGIQDMGRAVAIHVQVAGRQGCLVVDEVLGKQQVVVKGLGDSLSKLKGVSGGAILGDGRVGLILDVDTLVAGEGHAIH